MGRLDAQLPTTADPYTFSVVVWERNGSGSFPWTTIFDYGGISPNTNVGAVALSMDSNRATGTTVLAYSEVRQATNSTRLVRITRAGVATQTAFNSVRTIIDVNVRDTRCTGGVQVRYAATELAGGSHHETKVATGLWLDGQGAPSFSTPETVSTAARAAQAIFWGKYSAGAFGSVRTLFEEQQGALFGLLTDHAICTTNPMALAGLSCGGFLPCASPVRPAHL